MSSDTKYNGWSNYETWVVNLWIDNDEGQYNYWRDRARECFTDASADTHMTRKEDATTVLAQALQNEITDSAPATDGLFGDMLTHALGMVDWYEIAASQIDALEIVACATCGKEMLDEDAEYIASESDKSRPYCDECAMLDETDEDEELANA